MTPEEEILAEIFGCDFPQPEPEDVPLLLPTAPPPHKWRLCRQCGPTVICGYCGNNVCNGGTGTLPDGQKCGCSEASALYDEQYQQLPWVCTENQMRWWEQWEDEPL
jgi:hypothetical protein